MSGVTLNVPSPASINTNATTGAVELTESGGRALKLQTDTPHLVSLGGGRLSTAVTIHPIQQGRTTLGSGPGVDITIQGTGVEALHCQIENSNGIVTLYPISENLSIDGIPVMHPTRLSQGVMLTIGRSNYMRFNHPAEAQLMKSVLPNSRISMAPITFDTSEEELKFMKKPPVPRKNQSEYINEDDDNIPTTIQMKVSKFEYLAAQNFKKSISPKVFSSNLVTVNTPAKDVLGRAPPDLQDFAKNLSQSAVNYSNSYEKQKNNKMSDRYIFGRKSPQYVNVAINNEPKNVNNRVAIYENGCIPKHQNTDQQARNELNNLNNKCIINTKAVNLTCMNAPSPSFNRNPSPGFNRNPPVYVKSVSPTPSGVLYEQDQLNEVKNGSDSGFEDVGYLKSGDEQRRNQAYADRVKEQEIEQAEQARLEEILNMCAEYERQVQWERSNKPPTPNRIITNGSLPRDKRHCLASSPFNLTPSPSNTGSSHSQDASVFRFDAAEIAFPNYTYENVVDNQSGTGRDTSSRYYYENVEVTPDDQPVSNGYENVQIVNQSSGHSSGSYPQSPRTRIKTIPICNKDSSPKDSAHFIEKKFAILATEQHLLQNQSIENNERNIPIITKSPCSIRNDKAVYNTLKKESRELMAAVASIKRKIAEIQMQEEELNRELEMERALIIGEHKAKLQELAHLEKRKETLSTKAHEIEQKMEDCQVTQTQQQETCSQKLELAQEKMNHIETNLSLVVDKGSNEYKQLFEEFLIAQEILDNERKTFEDLEFHHLEEEADWLASREEIQREIVDLSKRIDSVTMQLNELEQQKVNTSQSNAQESKTLERQLLKYLKKLEEYRIKINSVDTELKTFVRQESDHEMSSDSDSDKRIRNMSYSLIQSSESKLNEDDLSNMSQSFNEKMLQEKTILEGGIGNRCPSQDDIDRISKVTSSAPLSIEDGRKSLGRKTIESLREIERNRQLHLVQQGSQVIEEERRRVLELKQKAQTEVRAQWAQRQQDCSPPILQRLPDHNNITGTEELEHKLIETTETDRIKTRPESEGPESPRPLSETSDISVEVGATLSRRRRQLIDKMRPLTRYLPIRSSELDLRQHIETAGHQVVLCPHVIINSVSCRGFLHKRGSKLNSWSKRWFVFDRNKRTLVYHSDKSEKKVRGGAYFQAIEEVYLDHANSVKSPNPNLTFIVKTHQRYYYLMAPSPEAMRIWIDVVFTGAEGYQEFEHGS